jgi:hypothetical protein
MRKLKTQMEREMESRGFAFVLFYIFILKLGEIMAFKERLKRETSDLGMQLSCRALA